MNLNKKMYLKIVLIVYYIDEDDWNNNQGTLNNKYIFF
jgi:hypothetical protein